MSITINALLWKTVYSVIVQTGGIIDPFSKADITVLDAYLSDILGAARTPAYVENSTDTGWSMGAYEYTE